MKSISILIFAAVIMLGAGDESKVRRDPVSECCVRAGVPDYCSGLCTKAHPMSRSPGKRINACTKYEKDIEKCWQPRAVDIPDKTESDVEPENAVTPVGKEKFLLVKLFEPFKEEIETKYRQCCCFCVTGCTPNCT